MSISRVLTRGRCDLPLAWRLASLISWCAGDVMTLRVATVGEKVLPAIIAHCR